MDLNEYKENLLSAIALMETETELEAFFSELLSESEIKDITTRWAILNETRKCEPQRKTAKDFGASLSKVNKCAKILQIEGGFIRRMLDRRYDERSL